MPVSVSWPGDKFCHSVGMTDSFIKRKVQRILTQFMHSEKATKIWKNLPIISDFSEYFLIKLGDSHFVLFTNGFHF